MISIADLHKHFGKAEVLRGVGFSMEERSTLTLIGRSGSGKTTLLRILAGMEQADRGSFTLRGEEQLGLDPGKRGIVYLDQEPLLFPHLDVLGNVSFGLRVRHVAKREAEDRAKAMIARLGLEAHVHSMPHTLSGGQRQRVAFGRALLVEPTLLLLDEPFSSLDGRTREEMRALCRNTCTELGISTLLVTHDIKEALIMGDRIGRIEAGKVQVYPSLRAFMDDDASGAQEEIGFWEAIQRRANDDQ